MAKVPPRIQYPVSSCLMMVESSGSMPCSLKLTRRFSRRASFLGFLFFEGRILALVDEPRAHGFGVLDIAERANLNPKILIDGEIAGSECGIFFLLEGIDQGIGVFLFGDRSDLHKITGSWNRADGIGRIGGPSGRLVSRRGTVGRRCGSLSHRRLTRAARVGGCRSIFRRSQLRIG